MPSKTRSQLAPSKHSNDYSGVTEDRGADPYLENVKATETFMGSSTSDATLDDEDKDIVPPAKRPPSPLRNTDGVVVPERVLKRPRQTEELNSLGKSSDGQGSTHASTSKLPLERPFSPKKPSSTGSILSPRPSTEIVPLTPRARSVPADGSIPHLDLSKVQPSPWRSPSKSKGKDRLIITSVPPRDTTSELAVATEADADGDVQMRGSSPPIQLRLPSSSRPPSPVAPLGISQNDHTPMSPLTPVPPTPFTSDPKPAYHNVQAGVKTHDSLKEPEAGPSRPLLEALPQPKTPFGASRLPKPVQSKPSGSASSVQLTLHQAFASMPSRAPPLKGVKARMKPKNASGSSTPNNLTPVAGPSRVGNITQAQSQLLLAPTSRPKPPVSAPRGKTVASNAQIPGSVVEKALPRTPAPATGKHRSKTPARAPVEAVLKTPAQQRSKSVGPSRAKTPARAHSPGRAGTPSRGRTPSRTQTPSAGRALVRTPAVAKVVTSPVVFNPPPTQPSEHLNDALSTATPEPVPRSESPLTAVSSSSKSRSPEVDRVPSRGRSPTPKVRRLVHELAPVLPVSIEPIRARSHSVTPERPQRKRMHDEEDGDEDTPRRPVVAPQNVEPQGTVTAIPTSIEANAVTESSTSAPVVERAKSNTSSPGRKVKRKTTGPPLAPAEVRMTRSASLRQKKNLEQKDKGKQVARDESLSRVPAGAESSELQCLLSILYIRSTHVRRQVQLLPHLLREGPK